MQQHAALQIERGPRTGAWIYAHGNRRMGMHAECCAEAWLEMMQSPADQRDDSPAWDRIGHATKDDAYAHMRAKLLARLHLDVQYGDWSGCRAPLPGGALCDRPTKSGADIPPMYFNEPLCDEHRTREVVEAMWDGPGDWSGSW